MLSIIAPSIYFIILTTLLIFDYKYHILPNKIVYPSLILVLALSWFFMGIVSSLIGGVIGLVAVLAPVLIFKIKAGMGDIKLGLLIGLMVGYPLVIVNALVTGIIGIVFSVLVIATKRNKPGKLFPFGAVMCLAAMITIIWGFEIWQLIAR